MAGPVNNLQDVFLNAVRRARTPVTMFLVKGVKLQGVVTWFDNFSLLLRRDGQAQLVYKHGISTIVPNAPVEGFELPEPAEGKGKGGLQDTFLAAAQGAVGDLRAGGPTRFRLVTEGDAGWVRDVRGIHVHDVDGSSALLELVTAGAEQAVLREAVARGAVLEFARVVPPLAEIYREVTA